MFLPVLPPVLALLLAAADPAPAPARAVEREARAFLQLFSAVYQPVARVAAEAAWLAATDASPEHGGQRTGAEKAATALAGSPAVITRIRAFLARERQLDPLTARQLRRLLLLAAENPGTIPEVLARRAEAQARQNQILDRFVYCLDPGPPRSAPDAGREADAAAPACARPLSPARLDDILRRSPDLSLRAQAWNATKEVGRPLKPGLQTLVQLRNQVAREMGYSSFFALQVADYGLTVPQLMALLDDTLSATAGLYEGLHCWARHQLAERFHQPAPRLIPAHWIGNRWAQTWPGLVETADLDRLFSGRSAESIVRTAESFYLSLGFPRLPDRFWQSSDLYPAADGRKKNAQAAAWHIDGDRDVRSLMNVEPDLRWFGTAHHELGHVYYYLAYARPEVPFLLRTGANRAFHEAIGELGRLASLSAPYLKRIGLLKAGEEPDPTSLLLAAAMDAIVFLPFAAGTMTHFERDLYEGGLAPAQWQVRWWQYVTQYQGVAPPSPRPADLCDACTKTQLHDDPARYYDYALATLIKFQLHDHICRKILKQDVRACDYGTSPAVGDFLRKLLAVGATRDWRRLLKETTGDDLGPRPLLEFFAPLNAELARRNQGKNCVR
jgi:peptidyl-dipeptidase A